jgi:hypothetical protein
VNWQGERGKTGDHGQKGDTGDTGPAGPANTEPVLPWKVRLAFFALLAVTTITLGVLGFVVAQNRDLVQQGQQAHEVLCVNRANDIARRDRAQRLLDEQPGGPNDPIHYLGLTFPRSEVIRSLEEARSQIAASDPLGCKPLPAPTTTRPIVPVRTTTTGG